MSWCALEKYFISSWNILRCDSRIQASTMCKAGSKPLCDMPAVVTEVSFYPRDALNRQGPVSHFASKSPVNV